MDLKKKFYMENYFLNNPLKFYIKPKKLRDFFVALIEAFKILLAKIGILRWSFNERLIERPFTFQNLPVDKKAKILDIGCSDSIMPLEMASLGYEVIGNDVKKYNFRYPNFKFLQGDILDINIEDSSLDMVTCISTLEHLGLGGDYSKKINERKDFLCINKIFNILKKKGRLVLTVPFGYKRVLSTERVYDLEELNKLTSKFKKVEEMYFYPERNFWKREEPLKIEQITSKNNKIGVALMVLEKK